VVLIFGIADPYFIGMRSNKYTIHGTPKGRSYSFYSKMTEKTVVKISYQNPHTIMSLYKSE
jgi:hypothetical protein